MVQELAADKVTGHRTVRNFRWREMTGEVVYLVSNKVLRITSLENSNETAGVGVWSGCRDPTVAISPTFAA